jgi:signal recognition particle GTPase
MTIGERTASERIAAERERYVARGVGTTPRVGARAEGGVL